MVMLTIKSKTETPNARLRLLRTGGTGDTTLGSKTRAARLLTNELSKTNIKPTLRERAMGLLVVLTTVVAALGVGRCVG